jgi:hypothetical protein
MWLVIHRCTGCRSVCRRADCAFDADGIFGPELLCPRCGELVHARFTLLGWLSALVAAVLVGIAAYVVQSRVAI